MAKKLTVLSLMLALAVAMAVSSCIARATGTPRFSEPSTASIPGEQSEQLTVSLKPDSLSETGLTMQITNLTENDMTCGMDFTVEQKRGGIW